MGKYAEGTDVPTEKTQAQIIEILKKRGATDVMMGQFSGRDMMLFMYRKVPVRLMIPQPDRSKFATDRQCEKEGWRRWRVLLIWVKGQLEMIDSKIMTPAEAFLPYLQLRDGRTAGEMVNQNPEQFLGSGLALPAPEGGK